MSERIQGKGYIDPVTNKHTYAPLGTTLEVDHIFPVKRIVDLPGFDTLNKSQMTAIIQDTVDFGNLQALPKGYNASKGASVSWDTAKGKELHPDYVKALQRTQMEVEELIQNQIRVYQSANRLGVK
jgi:hypothetical protein